MLAQVTELADTIQYSSPSVMMTHTDQCKDTEENNRIGKTRDHIKNIRDTKGTFHANMGTIKGRNGMNSTEAEDMKKR